MVKTFIILCNIAYVYFIEGATDVVFTKSTDDIYLTFVQVDAIDTILFNRIFC